MSIRHIKAVVLTFFGLTALALSTPSMAEQSKTRKLDGHRRTMAPALSATASRGMFSIDQIGFPNPPGVNPFTQPVDGIYIKHAWNLIEPQPGAFDFTSLDQAVTLALQNGKKIILSVDAGANAPSWLEQAPYNVNASAFVFSPGEGSFPCQNITIPWPWDPTYQQRFGLMQRTVAAHLQTIPGAMAALVQVKLTGIDIDSEQLLLTNSDGTDGPVCLESNAIATWQQVGYTPDKIIAAFAVLSGATANAFPGVLLGVPITENGYFPPISDSGEINNGPGSPGWVDVQGTIMANTLRAFPGRILFNTDDLTTAAETPTLQTYVNEGGVLGFQTNLTLNGPLSGLGTGCGPNGANTCSAAQYEAILMNGVHLNALWEELWPVNVQAYPNDVIKADIALDKMHP